MIKIVLADDEKYVLVVIKSILQEIDIPLEVVGEAYDGEDAYELCKALLPDILITDICMPRENGLDLIKKIRLNLPDINIIILSGYNEFSYAKQAIHFGVSEYLLKPIDENEVYKAIDKIRNQSSKKEQENFDEECNNAFNEIIHTTELQLQTMNSKFDHYLTEFYKSSIGVVILYDKKTGCDKKRLQQFITILKEQTDGYVIENKKDENEVICFFSNIHIENAIQSYIKSICNVLTELGYQDVLLAYSFKNINENKIDTLRNTYIAARQSLENYFWYKQERIFYEQGVYMKNIAIDRKQNDSMIELFILSIKLLKKEYIKYILDYYFKSIYNEYQFSNPVEVKKMIWSLFKNAEEEILLSNHLQTELSVKYKEFFAILNFEEAKEMIVSLTFKLLELYEEIGNKHSQQNIADAMKEYIQRNYNKEIDLESLASFFHFNPSYLSSLFKKKTGYNFSKYITEIRIDNAKKLLECNEFKVYEIAEQVGYLDTKYFTKMFKKITNMTPREYQRKYIKN